MSNGVLGPDHGLTLDLLTNLGRVTCGLGRCAEGERMALQTLETRTHVLGPKSTLDYLYNLAWSHARRGDRAQAMQRLRQAVDGGYLDVKSLAEEADFAPLHGSEFDALLVKARENASAARVSG